MRIAEELNLYDVVELCLCNLGILRMQSEVMGEEKLEIDEVEAID